MRKEPGPPLENPNEGHRERLKKRFAETGSNSLAEHERLELLLTYSIPRRDVKPLAKTLLQRFNTLHGVFHADLDALLSVPGLGPASAVLIRLAGELGAMPPPPSQCDRLLVSPEKAYEAVRNSFDGLRDEHFVIIYLNTKHREIHREIHSRGSVDQAAVYPRLIVRKSLERNAAAVILAHNHPSGDPTPSSEDKTLTLSVRDACKVVDVRVVDHIVVGHSGFVSLRALGLV